VTSTDCNRRWFRSFVGGGDKVLSDFGHQVYCVELAAGYVCDFAIRTSVIRIKLYLPENLNRTLCPALEAMPGAMAGEEVFIVLAYRGAER
jgi:hypothetical protein